MQLHAHAAHKADPAPSPLLPRPCAPVRPAGELAYRQGTQNTLIGLCACMFIGLLCTAFVPETKGKTLEEIYAQRWAQKYQLLFHTCSMSGRNSLGNPQVFGLL